MWQSRCGKVMDAKTNIKSKLPNRDVTEGPERAPYCSYYYAMGLRAVAESKCYADI
jgi:hypothetical protein